MPFAFLAIYFTVEILNRKSEFVNRKSLFSHPLFLLSLGFGFAFGMAMASKVNIYPLAVLLPGAFACATSLQTVTSYPLPTSRRPKNSVKTPSTIRRQPSTAHYLLTTG
jgi:hypothetical protein